MDDGMVLMRDRIACIVDDIQAGQQVIENVTELIEESKAAVEDKIEAEFAAIFKQLEKREQALLNRAKAISASKLAALVSHAEKLELALAEIDEEGSTGIVVEPRETCEVVCAEDPVFEVDEVVRDKVESFGEIGDTGALKVSAMLEAVVGHPKCTNFLAEVLNLIASMPVDEESGLINEDDVELLVTMLDEFKTPSVMERACMAICNFAGQNLALCNKFGADGGITMLLNWFDDEMLLDSEDVIAAACLTIGVVAQSRENEELILEEDGVGRLLAVMEVMGSSATVQENAMFALGTLTKSEIGRAVVIEAGGIPAIAAGMELQLGARNAAVKRSALGKASGASGGAKGYLEKATRALYFLGVGDMAGKEAIVETGVPGLLVRCIKENHAHPAVVEGACGVISMLLQKQAGMAGAAAAAEEQRARQSLDVLVDQKAFVALLECLAAFTVRPGHECARGLAWFGGRGRRPEVTRVGTD